MLAAPGQRFGFSGIRLIVFADSRTSDPNIRQKSGQVLVGSADARE